MVDTLIARLEYREFQVDLHNYGDAMQGQGRDAALLAGAILLQTRWKQAIQKYPLIDTGTYLRSISYTKVGQIMEVGTDIVDPPYPFFLEYGTSKMAARVHVRPMLETAEPQVLREMETVLELIQRRYT